MLLAAVLSVAACGCGGSWATLPFARGEKPISDVTEVLSLWEEGEGHTEDGLPTRGFNGQLMFFGGADATPKAVAGDVSVFLFDDDAADPTKPLHVYNFVNGAIERYRRESKMGTSYKLFVPYPREGRHRARCSLRVRFRNADGRQMMSDAADVVLAGPPSEEDAPAEPIIQTASYQAGKRPAELPPRQSPPPSQEERIDRMLAKLQRDAAVADVRERYAAVREQFDASGRSHAAHTEANRTSVAPEPTRGESGVRTRSGLKVYTIPLD